MGFYKLRKELLEPHLFVVEKAQPKFLVSTIVLHKNGELKHFEPALFSSELSVEGYVGIEVGLFDIIKEDFLQYDIYIDAIIDGKVSKRLDHIQWSAKSGKK